MSRIISWMASVSVWTFSNFIPRLKHTISQKLVWTRAVTLLNNFILFVMLTKMVFWLNERDEHSLLQRALNSSQYSELFCSPVQHPNPRQEVKRSLNSQDLAFLMLFPLGRTNVQLFRHVQHSVFILVSRKVTWKPAIDTSCPPASTPPGYFSGLFSIHSCSQCRNSPAHYSCS